MPLPIRVPQKSAVDVLVIEDASINRTFMKTILRQQGYSVTVAEDGTSGIAMARRERPKLILLDVGLPDIDGYEVCKSLKNDALTKDIPVIFATGHDATADEARSFEVGGADFIAKPIKPAVLLARVKAHISLQSQRRSLEGMFRDVVEHAPCIFFLTNTALEIIQTNAQAIHHFRCGRDRLIYSQLQDFIPDCMRHIDAPRRDVDVQVEVLCQRPDGTRFPGDATFSILSTAREPIYMVVVHNVSERVERIRELHDSRQLIREMAADHEATRENERKHIAREVHDELGQVMTALRLDLSFLQMQFGDKLPALGEKVADMKGLVDRAITGVRNVVKVLRPEALDLGLLPAIEWLRDEFIQHTAVECVIDADAPLGDFTEAREMLIYRIVQESLTNISRYAKASRVRITLRYTPGRFSLVIEDNGCGFDQSQNLGRKSYGILGMRERALTLGGEFTIVSNPGSGTRVSVWAPMAEPTRI